MKNTKFFRIFIILIIILLNLYPIFAQNYMENYKFSKIDYEKIQPKSRGWLEHRFLPKTYEECYITFFDNENLKNIDCIKYYPIYASKKEKKGCIEINFQKFYFFTGDIFQETTSFFLIKHKNIKYLIMSGNTWTEHGLHLFIFDITDIENIKFYSLINFFYDFEITNSVFGIFCGELCFFATGSDFDCKQKQYVAPYHIKNNEIKEFQNNNGMYYRIYLEYCKVDDKYRIIRKTF